MAYRQTAAASSLCKLQLNTKPLLSFHKYHSRICSSRGIRRLSTQCNSLNTTEIRAEGGEEEAFILKASKDDVGPAKVVPPLITNLNEEKLKSSTRSRKDINQAQDFKSEDSSKKSSGAITKTRSQSGNTTSKKKLKRKSGIKVRKTLSERRVPTRKAAIDAELKKFSSSSDLPSNWKKLLLKSLKYVAPLDTSEQAVLKAFRSKLSASCDESKVKAKISKLETQNQHEFQILSTSDLSLKPIHTGEIHVPRLSYGLERVLFNQGVYQLQDPRTRVFNFDPYLREIMPVSQFDFNALSQYITSSRDNFLLSKAAEEKKRYVGSTSSMSSTLSHFHFLLSNWRPIEYGSLSGALPEKLKLSNFTLFTRAPTAIFLRYRNGSYAIDADKEFDDSNILSMLGKSMEKLLTLPTERFERYRRRNSDQLTEQERNEGESYHYTTFGDFLLRSQLDAYDPRLPGTGMFDLKTRCVVSVRMDVSEYENSKSYEIRKVRGEWESYEREYYDMIRSAFLKYSMQVRMGRMDGIFVAFHNTARIFGFQYISLEEMDYALHGTEDLTTGNEEFKLSLSLLNKIFDQATTMFPEKTLRFFFDTSPPKKGKMTHMNIIAQPLEEEEVEEIQAEAMRKVEIFERKVLGIECNELGTVEDKNFQALLNNQQEAHETRYGSCMLSLDRMASSLNTSKKYEALMEKEIVQNFAAEEIIDEDKALEDKLKPNSQITTIGERFPTIYQVLSSQGAKDISESQNLQFILQTKNVEDISKKGVEKEKSSQVRDDQGNVENLAAKSGNEDSYCLSERDEIQEDGYQEEELDDISSRSFLAMKLTIRNMVNSTYVERPVNLTKDDKWTVEYCLTEYSDRSQSINVYRQVKKRRKAVHMGGLDMNPNKPPNNLLVRQLRKYIEKGRKFREIENEIESKMQIHVVGTNN